MSEALATGTRLWFEYHCWESEQSQDAHLWARSHQQVVVLEHDAADHDCLMGETENMVERGEAGQPCVYTVRFDDGLEATATEDELMAEQASFERPDPPQFLVDNVAPMRYT